jgi:PAS domain S-box-containing protein
MFSWRNNWPRGLAFILGVSAGGFGLAVLLAWHLHFIPLIQVTAGQPPLTRQAAFCYVLIGAALACLAVGRKRIAFALAAIVLALTVAVAFEYILNRDFGIDQLLGSGYITEGNSPPGRISPIAALSYFLASVSLLALAIPRLVRYSSAIAGIIASVIIGVGSVLFLVYRLAHMPTYGWGHFRHISIQASAVLVFIGFGILFLALQESWTNRTLPRWLPLACGLGLSAGSVGIWQALIVHVETQLPLLSRIILIGGLFSAFLVAIAVHEAQQATMRSHRLREGKAAFERLFDASADGLLVVDHDRKIMSANQRVHGLFGYATNEIVGNHVEKLVPGLADLRGNQREDSIGPPVIRPAVEESELFGHRKDGSVFPVEVALSSLRPGTSLQLLIAVRDITIRKQLEEDLEATRLQAIASARLSALGMMAGGIAHEINNPLGIIHAMASDLTEAVEEESSVAPEVVAQKGAVIRETAERIARIVKSLRQISREGTGDPLRPTPLGKIIAETLEICRAKFKANGVELSLPKTIPEVSVLCREVQISQALLNLLQNALDAVLEQDGSRWVRLEVANGDDSVALSVIDSGPGIPLDLRSRLGEPFFTTKPVGKGTGLGLSLSKAIAEDHGGDIQYSNDHGHTRFSLVLPLTGKADAA